MTQHLDPVADKDQYLPYYPAPEPGPRPLADILADLRRPIHPNYLKTKRKGGADITFIEWHTAIRILERYALGFHYRTRTNLSLDGQHVTCDAEIGIVSSDYGVTWRGSTGSDEEGEDGAKNYGDATDRAESQALRRAASKFGLGLPLYYDKDARAGRPAAPQAVGRAERPAGTQERSEPTPGPHPGAVTADTPPLPPASPPGNLASQAQLNMIYAIAGKQQINKEQVARLTREQYGRPPHELTKREASTFIESLQGGSQPATDPIFS